MNQLQKESPIEPERPSDDLLVNTIPEVDPHIPHYSSCGDEVANVIDLDGELYFITDDLIKNNTKFDTTVPTYEAPPAPIHIALPSEAIPSSPMVLRKQNSILSPRGNGKPRRKFIK